MFFFLFFFLVLKKKKSDTENMLISSKHRAKIARFHMPNKPAAFLLGASAVIAIVVVFDNRRLLFLFLLFPHFIGVNIFTSAY